MKEQVVSEKRLIDRLSKYWQMLKKDDVLPPVHKINNASIADVWESCFLMEIDGRSSVLQYKYQHVGQQIKNAYGKAAFGSNDMPDFKTIPGSNVLEKISECLEDKQIHIEKGVFINSDNKTVKFRSCILPFSKAAGTDVTHILVGLSWRAF